jgi:hypothetical protein
VKNPGTYQTYRGEPEIMESNIKKKKLCRGGPFKIVSGSHVFHSRWQPLLKRIEISVIVY